MKPANTCLILGAGASVPYGYPVGEGLAKKIIELGEERHLSLAPAEKQIEILDRAENLAREFKVYKNGDPSRTIDSYLSRFGECAEKSEAKEKYEVGLMLITAVIRQRECARSDVIDWYETLWEHIEYSTKGRFPWPLRVITFNYDRSLEFAVSRYHARHAGVLQTTARRWLRDNVEIRHVYGDVGPLPDCHPKRHDFAPEYGISRGHDFWKGRETIQIIGRKQDPECKRWIEEAEYVIVLGFGYDEMNCERLGLKEIEKKCIFSTAFNTSDRSRIESEWAGLHRCFLGDTEEGCFRFLNRTQVLTWALHGWPATDLIERLKKSVHSHP
jgi:hypothetical protein